MSKLPQIDLAEWRLGLITVLIVCFCSVLHIKQAWSEDVVYLDIKFDFDGTESENAEFERMLELPTTPHPIIGLNQSIRGNAPGIIKAFLSNTESVIEILWPGFNEAPLYSFIINADTLAQPSVQVISSNLHFGTQAESQMGITDPVIVIEPNEKFEAPIIKYSDSFYSILLPTNAIAALLSYLDYETGFVKPVELNTTYYGKWDFTDWNNFPHVTMAADGVHVAYVNRDPSEGSFKPMGTNDFSTVVFAKYPPRDA